MMAEDSVVRILIYDSGIKLFSGHSVVKMSCSVIINIDTDILAPRHPQLPSLGEEGSQRFYIELDHPRSWQKGNAELYADFENIRQQLRPAIDNLATCSIKNLDGTVETYSLSTGSPKNLDGTVETYSFSAGSPFKSTPSIAKCMLDVFPNRFNTAIVTFDVQAGGTDNVFYNNERATACLATDEVILYSHFRGEVEFCDDNEDRNKLETPLDFDINGDNDDDEFPSCASVVLSSVAMSDWCITPNPSGRFGYSVMLFSTIDPDAFLKTITKCVPCPTFRLPPDAPPQTRLTPDGSR